MGCVVGLIMNVASSLDEWIRWYCLSGSGKWKLPLHLIQVQEAAVARSWSSGGAQRGGTWAPCLARQIAAGQRPTIHRSEAACVRSSKHNGRPGIKIGTAPWSILFFTVRKYKGDRMSDGERK